MLAEAWAGAEKRPGRRPTSAWARPRPCRCVARASPPRIRVVYSSDNYLVVDKPPGLAHGLTEGQGPGVMQVLRNQLAAEGECCRIYGCFATEAESELDVPKPPSTRNYTPWLAMDRLTTAAPLLDCVSQLQRSCPSPGCIGWTGTRLACCSLRRARRRQGRSPTPSEPGQ